MLNLKSFPYLPLFHCPYCPEDDGYLLIDLRSCFYARRKNPDPRYLHGDRMESGQTLIRTGIRPMRWEPCQHLLRAEGEVHWIDHRAGRQEDKGDLDGVAVDPGWLIDYCWTAQALLEVERAHGRFQQRDYDKMMCRNSPLLPCSASEWRNLARTFAHDDNFRLLEGLEEMNGSFLVARSPKRFLRDLIK